MTELPEYLPASLVAEMAYCPRNAWYEAVEKWESQPDPALVKGKLEDEKRNEREKIGWGDRTQTRSITLSSEQWGVIAVVDAIEENKSELCPIEYKKGKQPPEPASAFFPEYGIRPAEVQVLLAIVLLQEAAPKAQSYGYIYYAASRKRVKVFATEQYLALLRQLLIDLKKVLQATSPPPPVADERCAGCSFAEVCQPQLVATQQQKPNNIPQRWPIKVRYDRTLYLNKPGTVVRKDGLRLMIEQPLATDTPGEKVVIPLTQVEQVIATGNVRFSSEALLALRKAGTEVVMLSPFGKVMARLTPELNKNIYLRLKQYAMMQTPELVLPIAKKFVEGKIRNARTMLMRYNRRNPAPLLDEAIFLLENQLKQVPKSTDLSTLMGAEGAAAKAWFQAFGSLLKQVSPDASFQFEMRNRRPPKDPVNALLSFAYTLLAGDLQTACSVAGLDPYMGFLHGLRYGRPSLALDLMEEFRTPVADSFTLKLINTGMIRKHHFSESWGGTLLTEAGRSVFFKAWNDRRHEEIRHPWLDQTMPWYRVYEVQARILAKVISGDLPEYLPFLIR